MIVFFEKFERNLVGKKSHSERNQNIDNMLIEVEIVWWLSHNARSNLGERQRERFVYTYTIDRENSYDDEQRSYDQNWHFGRTKK